MGANLEPPQPALRVPPHSIDAEHGLLGCALQDVATVDAIGPLEPSAFYRWEHQRIWRVVLELTMACKPVDVITVLEGLQRLGADEGAWAREYLQALSQFCVPSAKSAQAYAAIVRDRAIRRAVIAAGDQLCGAAYAVEGSTMDAAQIIDRAVTALLKLQGGSQATQTRDVDDLLREFLDQLEAKANGKTDSIGTGLRALDRLTAGGGRRGELWVIGARPSMGKTALSLALLRAVGRHHRCLMMTQEDSLGMLTGRMVAAAGGVNLADVRQPATAPDSMWTGVTEGVGIVKGLQLSMIDQGGLSMADVRRHVQDVKRRHGDCAMVAIDYLQLMDGEGDNRNQALGAIANGLKRAAKELDCWIVLLSQMNRETEKRAGPPQMSDLRDSGDIEGAADVIGLLNRPYVRTKKEADKYLAELHIVKHKNGPTDLLRFFFDGARQTFSNWDDGEGND